MAIELIELRAEPTPNTAGPDYAFRPTTRVRLDELRRGLSPRLGRPDPVHVRALAERVHDLPPIVVHAPTMMIVDGQHRVRVLEQCGATHADVVMLDCSQGEAHAEAIRLNSTHGKPLSVVERECAARRLLAVEPGWSDRRIALLCGLSDKTIARLRRATAADPQLRAPNERTGLDGKQRSTDPASVRRQVADLLRSTPDISARRAAALIRTSQATVLDVRRRLERGDDPVPDQFRDEREPQYRDERDRRDEPVRERIVILSGDAAVASIDG
jgi:ParB-like chromosome segregation protein Spo0J